MEIGADFWSFAQLESAIADYQQKNFVRLYRRDSRTIEATKKRTSKKDYNEQIVYTDIKYACVHGGKTFISQTTGVRPVVKSMKSECPFMIKIRASDDGQRLVITEMNTSHNHDVSETLFSRYRQPAKRKWLAPEGLTDTVTEMEACSDSYTVCNAQPSQPSVPKKKKSLVKKPKTPGMDRWEGRVAVVTGASSGIGNSVAKALVMLGMKVVGCAKTIEPIEALARELKGQRGSLTAMQCDVTSEKDIKAMFQWIRTDDTLGCVHVIVNSAGLAHEAPLLSGETSQWRNMLEVNILGVLTCTREAVHLMEEQGVDDGHIFLLNSMSGHRMLANKNIHFYGATKFMITALTEGIRNELREKKTLTRVTAISPAVVETNFFSKMYNDSNRAQQFLSTAKYLEAKDVADAVMYALTAPPHVQVHDILMRSTEQVS